MTDEEKKRHERIQDGIRNTASLFDQKKPERIRNTASLFDQKKPERTPEIVENSKSKNQHSYYMMSDLSKRLDAIIKEHDAAFAEAFREPTTHPTAKYAKSLGLYFNEICHITQVLIDKTAPRS
jgi:hypothetical protein